MAGPQLDNGMILLLVIIGGAIYLAHESIKEKGKNYRSKTSQQGIKSTESVINKSVAPIAKIASVVGL